MSQRRASLSVVSGSCVASAGFSGAAGSTSGSRGAGSGAGAGAGPGSAEGGGILGTSRLRSYGGAGAGGRACEPGATTTGSDGRGASGRGALQPAAQITTSKDATGSHRATRGSLTADLAGRQVRCPAKLARVSNYDKCPQCKLWVPRGETQCPHCGAAQGFGAILKSLLGDFLPSKTERKAGGLCVSCGRIVGIEDQTCPHCGTAQTSGRKAAKAVADVLPSEMSATTGILLLIGVLFVLPIFALSDASFFNRDLYLSGQAPSRGEPATSLITGVVMGAVWPAAVEQGQYWRLVTADWLHFGVMHILFNGLAILYLGRMCEELYGTGWFFFMYVLTGIGAFVAAHVGHDHVTAGASGSIFGLIGLGGVYAWRHKFANRRFLRLIALWTLLSVVIGMRFSTDHWAHGGGFVTGVLCGYLLPPELVTRGSDMNRLGARLGWAAAVLVACCFVLCLLSYSDSFEFFRNRGAV